jgi:hypothetical protein
MPGELEQKWHAKGESLTNHIHTSRNRLQERFTIQVLLASLAIGLVQLVVLVPFDIQKIIVRFIQPFIIGGMVYVGKQVIANPISLAVACFLSSILVAAVVYYIWKANRAHPKSSAHPAKIVPQTGSLGLVVGATCSHTAVKKDDLRSDSPNTLSGSVAISVSTSRDSSKCILSSCTSQISHKPQVSLNQTICGTVHRCPPDHKATAGTYSEEEKGACSIGARATVTSVEEIAYSADSNSPLDDRKSSFESDSDSNTSISFGDDDISLSMPSVEEIAYSIPSSSSLMNLSKNSEDDSDNL